MNYKTDHDEPLHPLWLGSLLLVFVILFISCACFIRKRLGPNIYAYFYGLNRNPEENTGKSAHRMSYRGQHNWAPVYVPPSSVSPKLYSLVRNIRMASVDRESSNRMSDVNDDVSDAEAFSIDETDGNQKTMIPTVSQANSLKMPTIHDVNRNRDSETARRFYASMRNTTLTQTVSSLDSNSSEAVCAQPYRMNKRHANNNPRIFHKSSFFHSLVTKN